MEKLTLQQYDALVAKAAAKGMSEDQLKAAMVEEGYEAPGLTSKALDYGMRALDYTSGLGRGAIGGVAQAVSGEDLGVNFADVIKGRTPATETMLEKAGVSELGSLSDAFPGAFSETGDEWGRLKKGGMLDFTGRGTAGFVGDVAADPLTYLSLGTIPAAKTLATQFPKVAKALQPVATGAEKLGESIYKSGLKALDSRVVEKGGEAVSPYMLKQGMGFFKGQEGLLEQMNKRLGVLGNERAAKYAEAPNAMVDPYLASQPALESVQKMSMNPYLEPKVGDALDFLSLANKPVNLQQASDIKTGLYDALPVNAFDPSGKLTSTWTNLNKDLSAGYRKQIVDQANAAKPGLGNQIDDINAEMGAYLGAQKPLRREIGKEARKDAVTQVDAITGVLAPQALAAKQGMKALNAGPVRTTLGLTLNRAGQKIPDSVWRQILLGDMNEK